MNSFYGLCPYFASNNKRKVLYEQQKYKQLSDSELISVIRNNFESHLLAELYNRYSHLVYGVGLKILGNKQDSEDMTMNLFISLVEKIKRQEIQHFKSWLYRVTLNECYMRLRKTKNIQESEIDEVHLQVMENEHNDIANLDCFDFNIETGMNQLKPEHRTVIQLFYKEEKSYFQISESVGWDVKTVKSYIQNAKRNLKIILEKLCDEK